jgi:peptide/nickel transport system substrate-binding protein
MDNRFGFKDFVFLVAIIGVIGAVFLAMYQFSHTEGRIDQLRAELSRMNELQQRQTRVLEELSHAIQAGGISVTPTSKPATAVAATNGSAATTSAANVAATQETYKDPPGVVRKKGEDGSYYVYFPNVPLTPHDARNAKDYSQGDWLVQNLPSEPKVITPLLEKDAYGSDVQAGVLEALLTRNQVTFEYEPFLAESYWQSGDGLTYRFVLRKGIVFSDGTPMTADDVVFTYNTVLTPGIDCDRYRASIGEIDSIKKVDDRTIEFKFKKKYFQALETAGTLGIIPQHIYKYKDVKEFNDRAATLAGSGPYLFDKWERGQQITMVRNPNYWGPKPSFDKVIYRILVNQQAVFQEFLAGQVDLFTPLPEQYEQEIKNPDFMSKFIAYNFPIPNSGYRYIGYNLTKPMFKDKETRQALTMLIDRKAIIKTIQRGMGIEITGPFSPLSKQADPSISPWPYDPAGARKKLAQAGWRLNDQNKLERDGKVFKFSVAIPAESPIYDKLSAYIKEQWAKAGIELVVEPYEFSVLVERLDNRNYDSAILGWTGGLESDPYQIWHSESIKDKGSNFVSFDNKEADALIDAGRAELDEDKRMEIWHKLHRIIHDEQPYTFLQAGMERAFINGRMKNTEPYKVGLNSGDWYVPRMQQKYK